MSTTKEKTLTKEVTVFQMDYIIKPLKVGMVGLGEQAWDNLLPSIIQNNSAFIQAVCDIDQQKLNTISERYRCETYLTYKEMIESEDLDCLVVASTPNVHFEVIKIALNLNIPIFIEKPPVAYIAQIKELSSHPNFNNLVTGIGINFNYAESLLMLSKLQEKEDFGNISYMNISHLANKPDTPYWGMESLSQSFLLSQAIHPISFVLNFGNGYHIKAIDYTQKGSKIFLNLNLIIFTNDSSSFSVNLVCGTVSPHFDWNMELITDTGKMVKIDSLWELKLFDANKKTGLIDETKRWMDVWHPSPVGNGVKRTGYYHELDVFFKCIKTRSTFSPSLPDMIKVYELMETIDKSLIVK